MKSDRVRGIKVDEGKPVVLCPKKRINGFDLMPRRCLVQLIRTSPLAGSRSIEWMRETRLGRLVKTGRRRVIYYDDQRMLEVVELIGLSQGYFV